MMAAMGLPVGFTSTHGDHVSLVNTLRKDAMAILVWS